MTARAKQDRAFYFVHITHHLTVIIACWIPHTYTHARAYAGIPSLITRQEGDWAGRAQGARAAAPHDQEERGQQQQSGCERDPESPPPPHTHTRTQREGGGAFERTSASMETNRQRQSEEQIVERRWQYKGETHTFTHAQSVHHVFSGMPTDRVTPRRWGETAVTLLSLLEKRNRCAAVHATATPARITGPVILCHPVMGLHPAQTKRSENKCMNAAS